MEGAFGAVGLVAGTLDGELGGATEAVVSVGDRVGGGQRQRDLGGFSAASSRSATASSTVAAAIERHVGVVCRSARREHS